MKNALKESNFIIYESEDGNVSVDVILKDETIWLTQKGMAELFDKDVKTINRHLINIFDECELDKDSTISKYEIVQQEGNRNVKRNIEFYNLDAIIAVGYRVNSKKATQFRIWATKVLKDYIIKGFVIAGSISHKKAIEKANDEYEKFRIKQDREYISSMDKMYKRYLEESKK